jgi:hypothetical protein
VNKIPKPDNDIADTESVVTANADAKRYLIRAYLDDLSGRVAFLAELVSSGHRQEALILCCVYLDGIGNWLDGFAGKSGENFCRTLINLGGESTLSLVLPKRLRESLPWKSGPKGCRMAFESVTASMNDVEAVSLEEMNNLSVSLSPDVASWLERNLWRGTIASVVHERLRTPNVHVLGSASGISFSKTTSMVSRLRRLIFRCSIVHSIES